MISEFVEIWEKQKGVLEDWFRQERPYDYHEVVKAVVKMLANSEVYPQPDPERITSINYGDYNGVLVFFIAASGWQPEDYWWVKVRYGSCPACDTLQAVCDDPNEDSRLVGYMTLALHIVQGLKELRDA